MRENNTTNVGSYLSVLFLSTLFFLFCLFVLLLVSCCLGPTEKKKKSPDCYSTMQFCDFGLAFLGVVFFVYLRFTVFFSLAAGMRGSEVFFFIYEYIDSSDSSHKLNTQFLG